MPPYGVGAFGAPPWSLKVPLNMIVYFIQAVTNAVCCYLGDFIPYDPRQGQVSLTYGLGIQQTQH